jgi:hypothetical protein
MWKIKTWRRELKCVREGQGCQTFLGTTDQNGEEMYQNCNKVIEFICFCTRVARFFDTIYQNRGKYTKLPLNSQMAIKFTKWP